MLLPTRSGRSCNPKPSYLLASGVSNTKEETDLTEYILLVHRVVYQ